MPGVGPVTAAIVIVSWSHPGRVRSEAAFAALAGTCPIPASSGNTSRHRLDRGGDRRLNWALHTIVIVCGQHTKWCTGWRTTDQQQGHPNHGVSHKQESGRQPANEALTAVGTADRWPDTEIGERVAAANGDMLTGFNRWLEHRLNPVREPQVARLSIRNIGLVSSRQQQRDSETPLDWVSA